MHLLIGFHALHLDTHTDGIGKLRGYLLQALLEAVSLGVNLGAEALFQGLQSFLHLVLLRIAVHEQVIDIVAELFREITKTLFILLVGVNNNFVELLDALIHQLQRGSLLVLLEQLHFVIDIIGLFLGLHT